MRTPQGKSFNCQEGRPWLKPGTVVWVQPGTIATKPYLCIIKESQIKWCATSGPFMSMQFTELCTHKPFKYGAVIWEYWVDRLSPANFAITLWIRFLYLIERILK